MAMRITKITTKSGDGGQTLLGCNLVSKGTHPAIELLGDLDELNTLLGNVPGMAYMQDRIFDLSAAIYKEQDWSEATRVTEELSKSIAGIECNLTEFIRPSGPYHMARVVCRRCERKAWKLSPDMQYPIFLNRLSDYLFMLSLTPKDTFWDRKNPLDNTKY